MRWRYLVFVGALAWPALLLCGQARAEDLVALYRAYWAGMPAAVIRLGLHDGAGDYRYEIAIRSEGLAHLVTRFQGHAVSEGRLAAGKAPEPARYDAIYDLKKRHDRHLSMRFVTRAGAVFADRGPDDTSRKPPLAEQFRKSVIDPISVLTLIRDRLRRHVAGLFTIPVYDGARRFDVVTQMLPRKGDNDSVLRLQLTLRPVAGFKGETSEDGDPDTSPRQVELQMTDDARLLPLSMSVPLYYLPLLVQFDRVCTADRPCPE
ncbi:MAG: DUF3108 domain-containing protein [Alphaproteobacteria bacterium]|nr:DUF3108 domain-containing protein [Alphaproteobacteria bacterium]